MHPCMNECQAMTETIDRVARRANVGEQDQSGKGTQQKDPVMPILLWLPGVPISDRLSLQTAFHIDADK